MLDEDGRVEITDPVWTFDAAGTIASGDGSRAPKLSFESGIDALVERLLDRSGATVETGTPSVRSRPRTTAPRFATGRATTSARSTPSSSRRPRR
ncbi:hypothetical protein [Halosegnis marinus]|uniref:hypothetical protein n=1 Tax=Halosegnis marinus TaxID=3034023 RepID=UPI00361ACFCA